MQSIPDMMTRFLWQRKLARVPSQEWSDFSVVTPNGRIGPSDKLWWTSTRDDQYFHKSCRSRFALSCLARVCYLASDQSITLTETNDALRFDDHLTLRNILNFVPPTPRKLSPSFPLNQGTSLLDLRSLNARFLISLERGGIVLDHSLFYENVIASRDESCYPITQAIARSAYKNHFDGIVYKSVRQATDAIVASSDCLVLFRNTLTAAIDLL